MFPFRRDAERANGRNLVSLQRVVMHRRLPSRGPSPDPIRDQQKATLIEEHPVGAKSLGFFYPRPRVPLPMLNRGLIALYGSAFWLLATPPRAHQQLPHMTRMIMHLELLLDYLSYPLQGPQIGGVACLKRPF